MDGQMSNPGPHVDTLLVVVAVVAVVAVVVVVVGGWPTLA